MPTSFPLVSIAVPAYNHDRYLETCLNSIVSDPYPEKEIIIINDGSTDNTHQKIVTWMEKNEGKLSVKYISRENRGICKTLNELIDNANGEFVRVIASDDYLLPGGISAMVSFLQANPTKKAVIGDCTVINEEGEVTYQSGFDWLKKNKNNYQSEHALGREVINNWGIPGPVLLLKRDIYQVMGKYDESLLAEDWDFYLRAVAYKFISYLDVPVAAYRRHNNNYSLGRKGDKDLHIALLQTRLNSARNRLPLFSGKNHCLLTAEIHLLIAKINYLKNKKLRCSLKLVQYVILLAYTKFLNFLPSEKSKNVCS